MKKVLIIDDDKEILTVISLILEMEGYHAVCKSNGLDVVDAVFDCDPDLILLDVMLGGVDGREVCKELKSHPATRKIPVIMISASHDVDVKECKADHFVSKPFDIDQLAGSVRRYAS